MISLPIDGLIPEILSALKVSQNLVLQASPGSGKTTRVPPALLDSNLLAEKSEILVLVPRRLAAKFAARRVAEERGENVGETIGYQFRFESAIGPKTRLKFLTEGLLLRRLISDPELNGVAAIFLDEFHERHLQTDAAISALSWLQKTKRTDLKIIVMSATLDAKPIATYLGENTTVLTLNAPPHSVAIHHLPKDSDDRVEVLVERVVKHVLKTDKSASGDVLVFLPGLAAIRACEQILAQHSHDALILPLHGEMDKSVQDLCFKPSEKTKIILSTNIAESSLTIDGVATVIDSGLHRQASYSWWSGVPTLKTKKITKASAIQRAGRAGRTRAGQCFRLFTDADYIGRPDFEIPEIRRSDLAQTLLEIYRLGADLESWPWFDKPADTALATAKDLLELLGALQNNQLTPIGKKLSELPIHPRWGRVLIAANELQIVNSVLPLVCQLIEDRKEVLDVLDLLHRQPQTESAKRLQQQLTKHFSSSQKFSDQKAKEMAARCLLAGFPDRVAKKRAGSAAKTDLIFCGGGSGLVDNKDCVREHDVFVVLDVQERQDLGRQAKVHVQSLCSVAAEDLLTLENRFLTEKDELIWDDTRSQVRRSEQLAYGEIILDESRAAPEATLATADFLLACATGWKSSDGDLPLATALHKLDAVTDPDIIENFFARCLLLQKYRADLNLPATSSAWRELICKALVGFFSREELQKLDWPAQLLAQLDPNTSSALSREVPAEITLSNKRRTRVHYRLDQEPWLESRLQDFIDCRETPKICGGKFALTLKLLAPNNRPVQVTKDLASFWQNTYPEIRGALARRYPRHQWP